MMRREFRLLICLSLLWVLIVSCDNQSQQKPVTATQSLDHQIDWESVKQRALERVKVTNFRAAKKKLYSLYENLVLARTFYCGCTFSDKKPDLDTCGVVPRKQEKRANRIEAEHIMPISLLGRTLECWGEGGRKNCGKVNSFFKKAEADLHNLVPAIGEINGDRSNYPPVDEIEGEVRKYGVCDVEIHNKKFEPPPHLRGDIARSYLYMEEVYGAPLTDSEIQMFWRWHKEDPPSNGEKKIHDAKAKVQGNVNPYIRDNLKKDDHKN